MISDAENTSIISEMIMKFKGLNGQIEVYEDKLIIKREGFLAAFAYQGSDVGDKTIYIDQITGIQFKLGGMTNGYIQFIIPGGKVIKGYGSMIGNENTVSFNFRLNDSATELKEKIEDLVQKSKTSTVRPQINLTLSFKQITLDTWEKRKISITNEGSVHAKNVTFNFSNDIDIRRINTIDVLAGETKQFEIPIKAKVKGTIPLAVTVTYHDARNKIYSDKFDFDIEVIETGTTAPSPVIGFTHKPLTSQEPRIIRAYEFYAGYIRVKISVKNPTPFTIHDVILEPDVDRAILYLERHEPEDYPSENERIILGTINPNNDRTVSLYLEPIICAKEGTDVHCHVRYKDAQGKPGSLDMEPLRIQVVCPIFETKEPVNIGSLKQLIDFLPSRDTKIFSVPRNLDAPTQLKIFQSVIQLHDIRHISTLRRDKNFESWYYGRTKVTQKDMVIKLGVVKDMDMVEITAFSYDPKDLTGLLAEINRHVTDEVSKRGNVQKIFNVTIKDSVVQRTNLMSFCDADGKCSGDVTIEDSVVMRTNILSPNHENPEDVAIPKARVDGKVLSPNAHDLKQSLKENSTISVTKNAINSENFQPVTSIDNLKTEEMHDEYARQNGVYQIYQFLKTNCKTLFPTYTIEGRSINFRVNNVLGYQIIDAFNIFPRLSDQNKGLKFQAYTYVLADFFEVAPESIKASLPQDSEEWHWQGKNTDDASGLQGRFRTIDDAKKVIDLLSKK
jgi:hypothetical protein